MYSVESKKRRPRFSNAELAMLVNEVYNNKEVLFSKKCSTYSNEQKSRAWQAVTDSINSVCLVEPRTPEEVRRKWYYYLSDKKKEFTRHKHQKKTTGASPNILYSSNDLKILELLGEIDTGDTDQEGDDQHNGGVEGLICEVDADALSLRSPPSPVAVNGDSNHTNGQEEKFFSPVVTYEEIGARTHIGNGAVVNGLTGAIHIDTLKRDSIPFGYGNTCSYSSPSKSPVRNGNCRRRELSDDEELSDGNRELLHLEKRRLMLQECQLQVLQDIQRQMQEDAARNRAFQEAFLDIQRQRLDMKKELYRQKKN